MNHVKAGVVVVTKFCKSSSKAFSSYIDYVDREEAARSNNTSKYNLYQDYMGNPEKSTGLFTETGDVQTMEEKTKLKDIFKQAQSKDSLMWQTVISFDNKWLEKNGLYSSKDKVLDEERLKGLTRSAVHKLLEKEGLENAVWSAAIHYNTDNIHVHVATVEPEPMREKKKYIQYKNREVNGKTVKEPILDSDGQPVVKEEYKGKFWQSSIDTCKREVVNQIINERENNLKINSILRDSILKQKREHPLVKDKELCRMFLELHKNMPDCNRNMWNYNNPIMHSLKPQIDEITLCYIEKYHKEEFKQFQKMIAREDGTRHYHGNSRSLNLMASGPWSYIKEPLRYYTEYAEGFNSELGTPSVPAYSTVKKFIPEKDLWPIGDVWYYHDLHIGSFEWKDYIEDVNRMGNASCRDAQEFCRRAQVINYNSHRFMFEAWNHKMWNNTSGLLLWMSHPAWPSMIWQTYSYDYETHGSFYGCKKACEPVHIQWNMNDRKIAVANIGLTAYRNAVASFSVYDLNGKLLYDRKMKISPAANALSTAEEVIIPQDIDKLVLVRLQLKDSKGQLLSVNDYWYEKGLSCAPVSLGSVGPVHLQASVKRKMNAKDNRCIVNMKNTSGRIAAFVKLNVVDAITGEPVLPAYTSEGYFNLLPGESKIVDIDLPESTSSDKLKLAVEQLNGESTVYDVF